MNKITKEELIDILTNSNIFIRGTAHNEKRINVLEKAIKLLNEQINFFDKEYIGTKDYAGFGDQEITCRYGYGPAYGSVVFEISKYRKEEKIDKDKALKLCILSLKNPNADFYSIFGEYLNIQKKQKEFNKTIDSLEFDLELN